MANVKILGLDLSMSCAGFAVIEIDNGKPILIHTCHVKTNAKQTHGQRLIQIADYLRKLVEVYGVFNFVAREKGFSRFANTTQTLFKVVGVSDLELAREGYTRIKDIAPTTVKKAVAGNGKASKEDVESGVRTWLGLSSEFKFTTNDESDAVAVALTLAVQEGLIC